MRGLSNPFLSGALGSGPSRIDHAGGLPSPAPNLLARSVIVSVVIMAAKDWKRRCCSVAGPLRAYPPESLPRHAM